MDEMPSTLLELYLPQSAVDHRELQADAHHMLTY